MFESPKCAHCGRDRVRARRLCPPCYYDPAVRALYPSVRPHRRDWTAKERTELVALRGAGFTVEECARRLGRTEQQVGAACKRFGLARSRPDKSRLVRGVKRLAKPGRADREIAERLGCSRQRVGELRKELDIPRGIGFGDAAVRGARSYFAEHGYWPMMAPRDARMLAVAREGWPPGCTPAQARVLAALEGGPRRSRDLTGELGYRHRQNAQFLLGRLRRIGWVERVGWAAYRLAPRVAERRRISLARKEAACG